MENGTYKSGEKRQTLQVVIEFKIKHVPGNEGHLKQLIKSSLPVKGYPVWEEDGVLHVEM